MPETIGVTGLRVFVRAMKDAGDDTFLDAVKDGNKAVGEIVASEARRRAPRRSGRLAGSIKSSRTQAGVSVKVGSARTPYVHAVHFGWPSRPDPRKKWRGGPISPNPFLYDAVDARAAEVVDEFVKNVNGVIARMRI